jgi:CheY-like chemotaxis protein
LPLHVPKARASAGAAQDPARALEPLRMVVVDDNEDAARALGMLLESDGHEVQLAFDAARGLQLIRNSRPSAAILDIGMPGMDGYDLARQIHQDPLLPDVALVAITGYGLALDRQRAQAAGFGAFVLKPASAGDIYRAVASALEARRC